MAYITQYTNRGAAEICITGLYLPYKRGRDLYPTYIHRPPLDILKRIHKIFAAIGHSQAYAQNFRHLFLLVIMQDGLIFGPAAKRRFAETSKEEHNNLIIAAVPKKKNQNSTVYQFGMFLEYWKQRSSFTFDLKVVTSKKFVAMLQGFYAEVRKKDDNKFFQNSLLAARVVDSFLNKVISICSKEQNLTAQTRSSRES